MLRDTLKRIASNPVLYVAGLQFGMPFFVVRFGELDGVTPEYAQDLAALISRTFGFVVFADTTMAITGGSVQLNVDVNTAKAVGALLFAGVSAVLDALDIMGVRIKLAGPIVVTITAIVASMLREFALTAKVPNVTTVDQISNGFIRRVQNAFATQTGTLLTMLSPLAVSQGVMMTTVLDSNKMSTETALKITYSMFMLALLANGIVAVAGAFQRMNMVMANMMRIMLVTGAPAALCLGVSLARNKDEETLSTSLVGGGLSLAAMMTAYFANTMQDNETPGRGSKITDNAFKLLYFLANPVQYMGPQALTIYQTLHTDGSESDLARKTAFALCVIAMGQNLLEDAMGYMRTHKGRTPEAVLLAVQIAALILGASQYGVTHGVAPYAMMLATLTHYVNHLVSAYCGSGPISEFHRPSSLANERDDTCFLQQNTVWGTVVNTFSAVREHAKQVWTNPYGQQVVVHEAQIA